MLTSVFSKGNWFFYEAQQETEVRPSGGSECFVLRFGTGCGCQVLLNSSIDRR